jgi:hypothetical protein
MSEAVPTADETIASVIPLHQPKKAKTGAERSRAYRQRKRKAKAAASPKDKSPSSDQIQAGDLGRHLCLRRDGGHRLAPRGRGNGNFKDGFWTYEALQERRWIKDMLQLYAKGTDK